MIDNDDISEAWDRVARTPEGLTIYRHLQRICMGHAPQNAPDSALPRLEGYRKLAGDLMAYMADGIGDNDRACVTFAVAGASRDTDDTRRGTGRRVTLDDAERVGNTELDKSLVAAIFKPPGANGTGGAAS